MRNPIRFFLAVDQRERAIFWLSLCATYAILAGLATAPGVGYRFRDDPTADPRAFVAVPLYQPLLWLPAFLGADAWGPYAWANTVYWIVGATIGAEVLVRLLARPRRAGPRRAPAGHPAPGTPAGRPVPPAGGAGPPAPAPARSGR